MPESILTNPLWSGKAYRVAAPSGNGAMTLICYNLNVSPRHQQVQATIKKEDYSLRNSFEKMSATSEERVLLYNWESQKAEELSDSSTFELIGFTDKLFHLCPIRKGWAVIGIQEKYLSPSHRPNYLFNREPLGAERTMYRYTKSMDRKFRQARTEKYFHRYPPKNCNRKITYKTSRYE